MDNSPKIIFAIPLRAKKGADAWGTIESNLRATVASVARQRTENVLIMLCGHDKPDLGEFDSLVEWIPADWDPPSDPSKGSWDKAQKRKRILVECRQRSFDGFYFFLLDADDFVDKDIVSYVLADDNRQGYIIDKGYVLDKSTDALAEMAPPRRPFHRSCGSCAIFWLTVDDLPNVKGENSKYWQALREHGKFPETSAEFGRPLAPIPYAAALYMINHGENLSVLQGVSVVQTKHAQEHNIMDKAKRQEILQRFIALP